MDYKCKECGWTTINYWPPDAGCGRCARLAETHNAEVDTAVEAVREALEWIINTPNGSDDYEILLSAHIRALARLSELAKQGPGG